MPPTGLLLFLALCCCTATAPWPQDPTPPYAAPRYAPPTQAPAVPGSPPPPPTVVAPPMPAPPLPLETLPAERPRNYVDFMFGASYWGGLGDLDPSGVSPVPGQFTDFDKWGFAFDIGYDRVVASGAHSDWTLGLELGWNTFDNDGSGLASPYSDITAGMFYITPVTRWLLHLSDTVTIAPGVGAGYYGFSVVETETYYYGWWWGYASRTLNQDSAFGGFVSLGLDFHLNEAAILRIDNKLHFVEFDGLQSLLPNETRVDGPIYTLEIGFALAF